MIIDDFNKVKENTKKTKIIAISIATGLILISLGISVATSQFIVTAITIIIAAFIEKVMTYKAEKEYNDAYKEFFVKNSLRLALNNYNYDKEDGIQEEELNSNGFIFTGDEYYSEDLSTGEYKNMKVKLSDVHIKIVHDQITSSGEVKRVKSSIFKGKWMIFELEKEFVENIALIQTGYDSIKTCFKIDYTTDKDKYRRIKSDNKIINVSFDLIAKSKEQSEKILNENVIEKIKRLDDINSGKLIICFYNNLLYVGISDFKDSFEAPSCFKMINEAREYEKNNKDLSIVMSFVDNLRMDNSIFK